MSPNHHGHSPPVYHRTPPGQVQKSCYGHYGLSIQKQLHLGCTWWKIQMSQYWHGANKGRAAPVSGRQFKSPPKMTWGSAPALYDNIGRMLQASSFSTDIQKITIELIAGWADWNSVWYCTYYYILYVLRYACSWLQLYVCRHVYNLLYIYMYTCYVYIVDPQILLVDHPATSFRFVLLPQRLHLQHISYSYLLIASWP